MECPFCNAQMRDDGVYGFLASHQSGEVLGNIFRCPNAEGFETEEEANLYLEQEGATLESFGVSSWEEVSCASAMHSVCGSFYTDNRGNLHEGYPC